MDNEKTQQLKQMLIREYVKLAPTLAKLRHVTFWKAEEAIHTAICKTMTKLAEGSPDGRTIHWKPYIMQAAVNELNMQARERRNGLPILRGEKNEIALANYCEPDPNPATKAEDKELAARAWTEMQKLPEQQREVLTRRYRDGAPFSQIGAALGIAESTARVHHRDGIEELRKRLWLPLCLAEIAWMWKKTKWRMSA